MMFNLANYRNFGTYPISIAYKAVPNAINNHVLTGKTQCIYQAIWLLSPGHTFTDLTQD